MAKRRTIAQRRASARKGVRTRRANAKLLNELLAFQKRSFAAQLGVQRRTRRANAKLLNELLAFQKRSFAAQLGVQRRTRRARYALTRQRDRRTRPQPRSEQPPTPAPQSVFGDWLVSFAYQGLHLRMMDFLVNRAETADLAIAYAQDFSYTTKSTKWMQHVDWSAITAARVGNSRPDSRVHVAIR